MAIQEYVPPHFGEYGSMLQRVGRGQTLQAAYALYTSQHALLGSCARGRLVPYPKDTATHASQPSLTHWLASCSINPLPILRYLVPFCFSLLPLARFPLDLPLVSRVLDNPSFALLPCLLLPLNRMCHSPAQSWVLLGVLAVLVPWCGSDLAEDGVPSVTQGKGKSGTRYKPRCLLLGGDFLNAMTF